MRAVMAALGILAVPLAFAHATPDITPLVVGVTRPVPTAGAVLPSAKAAAGSGIRRGAVGKKVQELQIALIRGGYLEVGSDSGTFDEKTEYAIKRLQCDKLAICGGSADVGYGVVGPKTAKVIAAIKIQKVPEAAASPALPREVTAAEPTFGGSFATDLAVGAESPDVRILQKFLNTLGFVVAQTGAGSPGFESEYYGRATAAAVARFRAAIGEKAVEVAGSFDAAIRSRVNVLLETLGGLLNLK